MFSRDFLNIFSMFVKSCKPEINIYNISNFTRYLNFTKQLIITQAFTSGMWLYSIQLTTLLLYVCCERKESSREEGMVGYGKEEDDYVIEE